MQTPPHDDSVQSPPRGVVKSPQDLAAGIMLLVIATAGFIGSWDLAFGQFAGIGSGMLPKIVAALIAAFGVLMLVQGFTASDGEDITPWSFRSLVFVLGAALLFAWTIRPLGLIIAAPLAIIFSSLADRDTRPLEIIIFAALMTAFCIGLFSFALRLPIPILPTALPYPFNS